VAVVVGGKVATRHKIRVAISGGKLQISCCGAGACEHYADLRIMPTRTRISASQAVTAAMGLA